MPGQDMKEVDKIIASTNEGEFAWCRVKRRLNPGCQYLINHCLRSDIILAVMCSYNHDSFFKSFSCVVCPVYRGTHESDLKLLFRSVFGYWPANIFYIFHIYLYLIY